MAIIGKAKCLSYMIDVLNNYRFNRMCRGENATYEDVDKFIPLIIPLGYKHIPCDRKTNNNNKCFIVFGDKCTQVIICFTGSYDNIQIFHREV
jgi:hypothetical protein